jgi:hypothetical protein
MWPSRPISRKYPSILPMPSRRTSPRYLAPAKSRRLELAPGSPRGAGLMLTNIRPLISLNSSSFTETTKWPHSSSQAVISAPEPPTVKTDSPSRPLKNRAERTLFKKRHLFVWRRLAVLTVAHSRPLRRILTASLEFRETAYNLLASKGSHRPPAKTMRPFQLRPAPPIALFRKRTGRH